MVVWINEEVQILGTLVLPPSAKKQVFITFESYVDEVLNFEFMTP